MMGAGMVQDALRQLGYYQGPTDGDTRSDAFRAALKRFQGDSGLVADGVYGPRSDGALSTYMSALITPPTGFTACRRWRLTCYYVAAEDGYGGGQVPVYDPSGVVVARVAPGFFASMALEGTGRLHDGRLLNVTGGWQPVRHDDYAGVLAIAQANRWIPDRAAYAGIAVRDGRVMSVMTFESVRDPGKGYGVARGGALDPFRTVAADIGAYKTSEPRFRGTGGLAPIGTRAWIPDFVGAKLPDGTTHDGWFTVVDTGGAIFGAHFDVFVGTRALLRAFSDRAWPNVGHVWFPSIDDRVPFDYAYGLV